MARKSSRGFTVAEMLVALTMFGLLSTMSLTILTQAAQVWRRTSSRNNVARSLTKTWANLRKDLSNSKMSASTLAISQVPASLSTGFDGDAVCFLSPVDPLSGDLANNTDGTPFMMRNVLYYLVVPQNHDALFGVHCTGGADTDGYEVQCPHKLLVRRMVDQNGAANPSNPATQNIMLSNWNTLLTRPTSLASIDDDNKIVASNLLTLRITPQPSNGLLIIDVRAVSIEEATRTTAVGQVSLAAGPFTVQQVSAIVPRNN